jgi:hypothetical protein
VGNRSPRGAPLDCTAILALNGFVYFLSMDGNLAGGLDAKPHLVAANINYRNHDILANNDAFIPLPG